jgi:hypothetical protein
MIHHGFGSLPALLGQKIMKRSPHWRVDGACYYGRPSAAVTIDKRVDDVETGYGASIEREAGVGAVSALDDYRATVLEAIKAGKEVPAFNLDATWAASLILVGALSLAIILANEH